MKATLPVWLLTLNLLVLSPLTAVAGVVELKNGDRVSGDIIKLEDEQLEVKTDFASRIYIDWEDIKSITSEKPLSLMFHDGATIPDDYGIRDEDRLTVYKLEEGGPVRLSDVKSINPGRLWMKGSLTLGGNKTTGNTETEAVNFTTDWAFRANRHRVIFEAIANRGTADDELTAENARGHLSYNYFLTRTFFGVAEQILEQDTFQNLALRSSTVLGAGYQFLDLSRHLLLGVLGPTVVYQDFTTEPSTVTPGVTWVIRWRYKFREDIVKFFHRQQGTQDFGFNNAFRWNAEAGIHIKIYGDLKFTVQDNFRFNSQPAPGRGTVDNAFIFGLTYELER